MKKIFSLDLRSLALFRVLLGIIFLYDLTVRFGHREIFYTDYGVLSRSLLISNYEIFWKMTLFNLNGSIYFVNILIGIGLIAGLMFILGIRTKVAGFICWLLLLSFQTRHPLISHGGDNLLRLLFFWGMFLPLNARFSFDSVLSKSQEIVQKSVSSVFTFSLITQICFMYIFTSLYKVDPSWMTDFSAVYYALSLDMFAKPLGQWIVQHYWLTQVLTVATIIVEAFGILLLFVPYKNHISRLVAIALFLGLHIGIWTTFVLGTFAPACVAAWLVLLPTEFWDYVSDTAKKKLKKATMYYDVDCGFCFKMVNLIKIFFGLINSEIKPAQETASINKVMNENNSWVVVIDDKKYIKFDAMLELVKISPFRIFLWPLFIFKPIGDRVYHMASLNRKESANILNRIGYSKIKIHHGKPLKIFNIFLILLVLAWNIEGLVTSQKFDIRSPWNEIVFTLQLNQQWNMFAPSPMKDDGWYLMEAKFGDGTTYDILNDKEFTTVKPASFQSYFKDPQWQKFLMALWDTENSDHRLYFGKYVCRKWNDENQNKLQTFKMYFMKERTPPPGQAFPQPEQVMIWEHFCF